MQAGDIAVGDIEQGQDPNLWYYTLERHKTQKHIGKKIIPLGALEQKLIAPYLEDKTADQAIFSPRQAMEERGVQNEVGDFYDKDSYRRAIVYAIKKGNKSGRAIPHWTPYQLRHATATELTERIALGREVAREKLGHTKVEMTKRYTQGAELTIAEELARKRQSTQTPEDKV
jgi:integrase